MPAPHPDFAIFDIGGTEVLIIMLITLLLFGSKRLPELARSMGKSIREIKKATSGFEEELRSAIESPPPATRVPLKTAAPPPQAQPAAPTEAGRPQPPENPPYP